MHSRTDCVGSLHTQSPPIMEFLYIKTEERVQILQLQVQIDEHSKLHANHLFQYMHTNN